MAMAGAALLALVTAGGGQAHASAGCDAVNAGGFNTTVTNPMGSYIASAGPISGFAVGETLTFTVSVSGASFLSSWTLSSGNSTVLATLAPVSVPPTQSVSYTVTGTNQDTTLGYSYGVGVGSGGDSTVTVTCTPVASGTDSNKLRALQVGVSKLVAETSGAAITHATDGAISSALNGGGNPITVGPNGIRFNFAAEPRSEVERRTGDAFAALGYAGRPVYKARPLPPVERLWSLWADVRGTGWDRNDATAGLRGNQLNATAGIGYKLTPNLVVGLLAGYENFKYEVAALTGTMKGDGGTFGGYAGWKIAPDLRWDATLAWSSVSYDGVAGIAHGSFDGSRILASTGLTGSYRWAAMIFEPSARVYALWERDDAYTDSLGTLQAERNFSVGRASAGGKAIYPWMSGDVKISPYLGLYGDYRFSSGDALPVGQPVIWVGDGLSGRVTGGVTLANAHGGPSVGIGSEVGGLGADYKVWNVNGRVFWPF